MATDPYLDPWLDRPESSLVADLAARRLKRRQAESADRTDLVRRELQAMPDGHRREWLAAARDAIVRARLERIPPLKRETPVEQETPPLAASWYEPIPRVRVNGHRASCRCPTCYYPR